VKAVIMAGGEGTRLRPLTSNQPKPMMPLGNQPMMEHVVRLLKAHGFDDVVVTVAFMPNAIRTYFGDGSEFGVRMVYATEETPLGTAGSIRNAMDELDDTFLVISGDVLTDIDLSALVTFHHDKQAMATIGLKAMENPLEFGIVITRDDGSVDRFLEKPTWGQVFSDTINTGVYVLAPAIFDYIPEGQACDFSSDVFPRLLADGRPLYGHVATGYWEDVGTLEAYRRAHDDVLDGKVECEVPGFALEGGQRIWLGEGVEVDPGATIEGPAALGDYCKVEAGAHVGPYAVLGANVILKADARVEHSVVHDNAYVGPGAGLRGAVVGRSCDLRAGVRAEDGVVLGDDCFVGEHAVLQPGVKVYPFKTVEAGAIVNSSIVWESRGARSLFGRVGVAGLANVDITPELAMRVAMAYATTLKKGATVVTSRDSSRAARALKRAMMAGLNAAGVNVTDLEAASVPVTRYQVRTQRASGGITVRLTPGDHQQVVIRFFATDGTDIDEGAQRKIDRIFHREDFRRAPGADIGDIGFAPRALEYYTESLMATVDAEAVRRASFKVVVDYAYGTTAFVMPNVLSKLGADVLAVNPYAATAAAGTVDLGGHAARVGDLVRAAGAHLGAVIHPGGEAITLVDDEGHVLSDDETLFALLTLVAQASEGAVVALPVAVSRQAQRVAAEAGASIRWTKLSIPHLMEVCASPGVVFGASQDGGYLFPQFLPAPDGTAAFVHTLALLARTGLRLSKVVAGLPEVHVVHRAVETPWERKGLVMRTLVEEADEDSLVLIDGVKVLHGDGWALVVPDPDEATTHVWAEGRDDAEAAELADRYAARIERLAGD
jgi:mannose-1-phosphate guanylyltransferase/phosphomannomutase